MLLLGHHPKMNNSFNDITVNRDIYSYYNVYLLYYIISYYIIVIFN